MNRHAAFRPLTLLLLALILSPLTAPFSSLDLRDLLDDRGTHDVVLVQAKASADKLPVTCAVPQRIADGAFATTAPVPAGATWTSTGLPVSAPLRI